MNTYLAEQMAKAELRKHGLTDWRFEWDRAKTRAGACYHSQRKITMSSHYVSLNDQKNVINTILHEIAHALVGPGHGHDRVWQAKARSIGCDAKRCTNAETPTGEWVPVCDKGHKSRTAFHRAPLRVRSCVQCSPTFSADHVMHWTRSGRRVPVSQMPARYRREYASLMARKALASC